MADEHSTHQAPDGTPPGAVIEPVRPRRVSEGFIATLRADGISKATIRSIQRDNARLNGTRPASA